MVVATRLVGEGGQVIAVTPPEDIHDWSMVKGSPGYWAILGTLDTLYWEVWEEPSNLSVLADWDILHSLIEKEDW